MLHVTDVTGRLKNNTETRSGVLGLRRDAPHGVSTLDATVCVGAFGGICALRGAVCVRWGPVKQQVKIGPDCPAAKNVIVKSYNRVSD